MEVDHKRHNASDAPPHADPMAASNANGRIGAKARIANALPKASRINVDRSFNMLTEDSGNQVHSPESLVRW